VIVTPSDLKAGDRLHHGPDKTAVVRHVWHTDNWTYVEVDDLYFPLMIEPHSTVTVERDTSREPAR
jgi:hypothetical protein